MTVRSSDSFGRPVRRIVGNERGAVLAITVLALIVLLACAGLAIDLGRGYITKIRLARAVDAAALAGARALRQGQSEAHDEAEAVAAANGVSPVAIEFGENDRDEETVDVSASRILPTTFMMVVNIHEMNVAASAQAAVPPLDIVSVTDTSGSLDAMDAFDDLQEASKEFVRQFSDEIDQFGLVSFQLAASDLFVLDRFFRVPITQAIDNMASAGDTNVQEGLRRAHVQLTGPDARPNAAKVVVFFTDGRPTAMRGDFGDPPADRIVAIQRGSRNRFRGLYYNPEDLSRSENRFNDIRIPPWPGECSGLGNCLGMGVGQVRNLTRQAGLDQAALLREDDILIYAIGLGNPDATDPLEVPDLDFLREIANEGGVADSDQPRGKMYFAPSADELRAVFQEVARDLIVRLAR